MYNIENLKKFIFSAIGHLTVLIAFAIALGFTSFALALENEFADKGTEAYWLNEIKQDSGKALNYFNLGVIYQKNKKNELAIVNYNKAIGLKSPLTPVAIFYKAKAYESLGKIDDTKQLLSTLKIDEVPENLKKMVLEYKNKLFAESAAQGTGMASDINESESESADEANEKVLNFYIEAMVGKNSNPNIYADTQTGSIQADAQTQFRSNLDFLASVSSIHDFTISYAYSNTQFDRNSTSNYSNQELYFPLALYWSKSKFKITPLYSQDSYSGSVFSESTGGDLAFSLKLGDDYLNFTYEALNINNKTTTYSYLTGKQQKLFLSYDRRWAQSKVVTSFYKSDYAYVDTTSLASSYSAFGFGLSYVYYFANFDLNPLFNFEIRQYKKATSNPTARLDQKYMASVQLGYSFKNNIRIFLDGSILKNVSNFNSTSDDRNYQQNTYAAGLAWSY